MLPIITIGVESCDTLVVCTYTVTWGGVRSIPRRFLWRFFWFFLRFFWRFFGLLAVAYIATHPLVKSTGEGASCWSSLSISAPVTVIVIVAVTATLLQKRPSRVSRVQV